MTSKKKFNILKKNRIIKEIVDCFCTKKMYTKAPSSFIKARSSGVQIMKIWLGITRKSNVYWKWGFAQILISWDALPENKVEPRKSPFK